MNIRPYANTAFKEGYVWDQKKGTNVPDPNYVKPILIKQLRVKEGFEKPATVTTPYGKRKIEDWQQHPGCMV